MRLCSCFLVFVYNVAELITLHWSSQCNPSKIDTKTECPAVKTGLHSRQTDMTNSSKMLRRTLVKSLMYWICARCPIRFRLPSASIARGAGHAPLSHGRAWASTGSAGSVSGGGILVPSAVATLAHGPYRPVSRAGRAYWTFFYHSWWLIGASPAPITNSGHDCGFFLLLLLLLCWWFRGLVLPKFRKLMDLASYLEFGICYAEPTMFEWLRGDQSMLLWVSLV